MNQHDEQAQSTLNVFLLAKLRLPQDMVDKTQDILPHAYYVTTVSYTHLTLPTTPYV